MFNVYWLNSKSYRTKIPRMPVILLLCILSMITLFFPNMQAAIPISVERILQQEQSTHGDVQKRYKAWRNLLINLKNKPIMQQLEKVNSFFNLFRYDIDSNLHGVEDYWESPDEFIVIGGGDCEDFAIIKYFTLVALGVPTEKLRITYVSSLTLKQAHMVLSYYASPDAEPLILDSLENQLLPASKRPDLKPVYSFNGEGLWLARQRGQSSLIGQPTNLGQWGDVLKRMQQ